MNGVLAVTRALGDNGMHKAGCDQPGPHTGVWSCTTATRMSRVRSGWWLLLCCDGVSDVLSEVELQVVGGEDRGGWCQCSAGGERGGE